MVDRDLVANMKLFSLDLKDCNLILPSSIRDSVQNYVHKHGSLITAPALGDGVLSRISTPPYQ